MISQKKFTHLRVASGYSFKFGTAHPHQLVERAAEFNMDTLALTDRDNMAGVIRFAQSCEKLGIAPILGINLSFIQKKYRVTLLAQSGHLSSLYRLVTAISMNNSENILTNDLLEKFSEYSKNVLILHGPESQLASAIAARRDAEALSIFNSTRELFADQAIECVTHQIEGKGPFSTSYASKLLGFAHDNDLPAILTNAARMLDRTDAPVADVLDSARKLIRMNTGSSERSNLEAYFKNAEQMHKIADEIARLASERNGRVLLATTQSWAERATLSPRLDIGIGEIHLPEPSVLGVTNHDELAAQLRLRCEEGLSRRYKGAQSVKASERLEQELSTVRTLGYESYFLTVADITDMARDLKVRVAARGSGAGSLICYVLGISGVEPLSQGLIMERFCSPLRNELPDIDIDVESARRLEIYNAVFQRYADLDWDKPGNQSRCVTVAMVETYGPRQAIRDVGFALDISPIDIDLIAKAMPNISAKNIPLAFENLPELKSLNVGGPEIDALIELAARLDGLPRHLAMHPCAVALSDIGLHDHAPIMRNASGYPMVQFDKDDVEAIGLLKLDILGVKMQSAFDHALSEIERVEGQPIDIDAIPLNDKPTFDLLKSTRTVGVFQLESPGQRELVGKFAPSTFVDLIIEISLFRPGPVQSDMIVPFLDTRQGFRLRPDIHAHLKDILSETEGVVVFHEQVIRIIATLTGVSLAEADEKRRELGDEQGQQRVCDWFYPASLARGYSYKVVEEIWKILSAFASFGFCRAHATAFALPTYQSAWLKTHHTAAFIAALLTHDPGMYDKRLFLDEARQWGIAIAPIDVNKSEATYRVERTTAITRAPYVAPDFPSTGESLTLPDARGYAIRISLADIKGISKGEIASIIARRPYVDLADFVYRSGASRPTTEALILVGAFDGLHQLEVKNINRRDLMCHLDDLNHFTRSKRPYSGNQLTMELRPSEIYSYGFPDLTEKEKVDYELEYLGMDISHHQMEFYRDFLDEIGVVRSCDLLGHRSGSSVLVAGVKVARQEPPLRSRKRVIFLSLDDGFGVSDATFFEDTQNDNVVTLRNSKLLVVRGEIRRTGSRGVSLQATEAWNLLTVFKERHIRSDHHQRGGVWA